MACEAVAATTEPATSESLLEVSATNKTAGSRLVQASCLRSPSFMRAQIATTPRLLYRRLHPRLTQWFRDTYAAFTHAQLLCVPAILERKSILLTSPTGSGKTLAGFLGVFDFLLRQLELRTLPPSVQCIYISPLRALAYDIGKNLRAPMIGMGLEKELRLHLRTSDTPPAERVKFRQRPTHFLITTPESLAVMLAQESYANHLGYCQFVIVDELHSFRRKQTRRGSDSFAQATGLIAKPDEPEGAAALSHRTFRDGGATRFAREIPRRRRPRMPERRSASGEKISRRSVFSDSPRTVSARGTYRRAALR
jgi:hypothetical protein